MTHMEKIQKYDVVLYKFINESNIYIGSILFNLEKKKAHLKKLSFNTGSFKINYWKKVENDIIKSYKIKFIYYTLVENMNIFNVLYNRIQKLGFRSDFKKLPVSVYFKNDEVFRVITMYIKYN